MTNCCLQIEKLIFPLISLVLRIRIPSQLVFQFHFTLKDWGKKRNNIKWVPKPSNAFRILLQIARTPDSFSQMYWEELTWYFVVLYVPGWVFFAMWLNARVHSNCHSHEQSRWLYLWNDTLPTSDWLFLDHMSTWTVWRERHFDL